MTIVLTAHYRLWAALLHGSPRRWIIEPSCAASSASTTRTGRDAVTHHIPALSGCLSWRQFWEEGLEPIDGLDPAPGERFAAVGEHPQRLELTIELQHPQGRGADRDHGDRVGIVGVGRAVVAGVEDPDPDGELGGTSTTCAPSSRSRRASGRPAPLLASTAQIRSGQDPAYSRIAA